jgi:hypothetical protein
MQLLESFMSGDHGLPDASKPNPFSQNKDEKKNKEEEKQPLKKDQQKASDKIEPLLPQK